MFPCSPVVGDRVAIFDGGNNVISNNSWVRHDNSVRSKIVCYEIILIHKFLTEVNLFVKSRRTVTEDILEVGKVF